MKSPELERGSLEIKPTPKNEAERKINSPDKISEFPEDEQFLETRQEKEQIDKKIEEVLSWFKESEPRQSEFVRAVEELKSTRVEKEKGTFGMLRELWSVVPSDCKAAVIGEFIFNPNALKARYFEEMNYRQNMKNRWRK